MTVHKDHNPPKHRCGVATEHYAKRKLVKPQTVRKRYSQTGSYFGDRPVKLSSGRLLWPDDNVIAGDTK
jgi:hypothetical protein